MKKILCAIGFLFSFSAFSQPASLDVAGIPDTLKKNASIIKRFEDIVFEVSDIDRATLDVHQIYTIMNEQGKGELLFNQYSSKWLSLDEAEIRVFEAGGKQVAKYKKKDMTTVANGEALIEDGFV